MAAKKASRKPRKNSTICPFCGARQGVVDFSQVCYRCGRTFFP